MKYTGKRKWSERDHPRDPRTGEFVEKTGAHAGWLMNIANRLPGAGPNLGGGTVGAGGTLRPGVGTRSASSLRKGDHARVNGVDSTGRKTSFTGYVQGVGPVTMRQGKQRTPMLAVQVAETPSGGGGARTTVYVPRDAKVERARPGGDVARLEGTRTGDDKLAQLMAGKAAPGLTSMSDEQLERAFRDQQGRMAGLSVTDPRFVEQDAIAKALRAERARRAGPLEQRVSDQIGKARGELDTPRVKRDDSGMSPATKAAARVERKRQVDRNGNVSHAITVDGKPFATVHKTNGNYWLAEMADGSERRAPSVSEVESWAKGSVMAPPGTPRPKAAGLSLPDLRDESGRPPTASKVANAVNVLKSSNSRDEARAALEGLTVAQIKQVGEGVNRRGFTGRKADIIDQLIASTVGHRLTTDAILDASNYRRTDASVNDVAAKATFTPIRDPDPNSKEGFALSLRQLPGGALRGTAAELEAGDITPSEAADRLSQFLRSPAARAMSQSDRRGFSTLEGRMRAADRAAFGLDRPAPVPAPGVYDSITKRATLLAMLRQRSLKAKRGAPDDVLRQILVDNDRNKEAGIAASPAGPFRVPESTARKIVASPTSVVPRESVADAQTVESLAAMKRPALLALRRNTPGTRTPRRGATEREIAEEIVRARNENKAAATRKFEALRDPENLAGTGADTFDRVAQRAAESRTSDTIGMLEADNMIAEVLANLSEPGARAITFRSLAGGHAANKPVAKKFRDLALQYQNEADAKLANDFADNLTVRTSKSLPGKKKNIPNLPDGYEVRDTGKKTFDDKPKLEVFGPDGTVIGTVEQYESRTPTKKQGNVALGWRTTKGWRFTPAGSRFPTRESTDRDSISAAINGHLAFAPKAEPAAPARVNFADSREIFNRHSQLTRAQFDAMPADARERILDELRSVRDSGEQQSYTNRGTRSNLGITSRGLTDASWVRGAREKIRELTYVAPPPVDNSIAGRAARLKSGDTGSFGALDGVTLDEFADLAKAAGFAAPGRSWKRPKAVKYLEDQVRMGDRRPKSSNPAQMAEAMRGATNREALAILDYVEAGQGLTKADMKAIAKELGVPLRNGDTYTMKNALAAAAKEAVGKA